MTKSQGTQSAMSMSEGFFSGIWEARSTIEPHHPVDGISIWAIHGEKVMMSFVRIEPDTEMPEHSHPHEQAGTILEGELILTVGGQTETLGFGDAYFVEPNVPHGATAGIDGCIVLDAFSPPRDEYRNP